MLNNISHRNYVFFCEKNKGLKILNWENKWFYNYYEISYFIIIIKSFQISVSKLLRLVHEVEQGFLRSFWFLFTPRCFHQMSVHIIFRIVCQYSIGKTWLTLSVPFLTVSRSTTRWIFVGFWAGTSQNSVKNEIILDQNPLKSINDHIFIHVKSQTSGF